MRYASRGDAVPSKDFGNNGIYVRKARKVIKTRKSFGADDRVDLRLGLLLDI